MGQRVACDFEDVRALDASTWHVEAISSGYNCTSATSPWLGFYGGGKAKRMELGRGRVIWGHQNLPEKATPYSLIKPFIQGKERLKINRLLGNIRTAVIRL